MSSISENVVEDRLSMLPKEILSHILDLMPTKYAVRTSILSKRWRYTWTLVTNLDLDYTQYDRSSDENMLTKFVDGNEKDFTKFVDRVLRLCKTSHVISFRLHISNYHHVIRSSVSSWIDKAVRLNIHELDICLIHHEVPLSVLTCKTLTKLRLELSSCDLDGWEFPSQIYLPCLKTLDVVWCNNPSRIHGCPVLESLSSEALCCRNEEVCIFNIPMLKQLKLIYHSGSSHESNKIVLRVPKLEYLFVGGILCSLFVMEDVSSLVGASIACWTCTKSYLWVDLLNKIRGVEYLSIMNLTFTSPLPVFPNMKRLELNGLWNSGQITHVLDRCPLLKILCIDSVDWRVFKSAESSWIDFQPKLIPACMLTSLTTIKFSKCEGDKSDIEFLEYMLGNSQVLKTVTIYALENLLVEEDPWFCAQVLNFPRASPHCEIHFRSWKLPPPQPVPIDVAF